MRTVTSSQMRGLDRRAVRRYGIPSLILMENAGAACAREALKLLRRRSKRVAVFSGAGNNGGDGFVAARHLANAGCEALVFFFQKPARMKPDPRLNLNIIRKMGVRCVDCSGVFNASAVAERLSGSGLILDAVFGTGLSREVEGLYKTVIGLINASGIPVLAVDIPSGLNADTGKVMGVCVRARRTVTLGLPKKGLYAKDAKSYTGKVVVADISIPRTLLKK